jgi:hypothetical protein
MATIAELRSEPPLPAASPLPPSTPVRPILDLSQIVSEPVPDQSPMMTATPPSRNGNGLPGTDYARKRVTLSREEAQIAAIAGISVQEYAANKLKLEREKARAITDKSTWLECPSTLASSNGFTAGVTLITSRRVAPQSR